MDHATEINVLAKLYYQYRILIKLMDNSYIIMQFHKKKTLSIQ